MELSNRYSWKANKTYYSTESYFIDSDSHMSSGEHRTFDRMEHLRTLSCACELKCPEAMSSCVRMGNVCIEHTISYIPILYMSSHWYSSKDLFFLLLLQWLFWPLVTLAGAPCAQWHHLVATWQLLRQKTGQLTEDLGSINHLCELQWIMSLMVNHVGLEGKQGIPRGL